MKTISAGAALGLGLIACGANAQGVVTQHNLSLGLALAVAQGARAECLKKGFHTTIAVVDRSGQLMVLLRDEAAAPTGLEGAERKAYTARVFRRPSLQWAQEMRDRPEMVGQRELANVIPLGGGLPIKVGDETIGAVASAGGPGQEQDQACAQAGIDAVAGRLK